MAARHRLGVAAVEGVVHITGERLVAHQVGGLGSVRAQRVLAVDGQAVVVLRVVKSAELRDEASLKCPARGVQEGAFQWRARYGPE